MEYGDRKPLPARHPDAKRSGDQHGSQKLERPSDDHYSSKPPQGRADSRKPEGHSGTRQPEGQHGSRQSNERHGSRQPESQNSSRQSDGRYTGRQSEGHGGSRKSEGHHGSRQSEGHHGSRQSEGHGGSRKPEGHGGSRKPEGQHGSRQPQGQHGSRQPQGQHGSQQGQHVIITNASHPGGPLKHPPSAYKCWSICNIVFGFFLNWIALCIGIFANRSSNSVLSKSLQGDEAGAKSSSGMAFGLNVAAAIFNVLGLAAVAALLWWVITFFVLVGGAAKGLGDLAGGLGSISKINTTG